MRTLSSAFVLLTVALAAPAVAAEDPAHLDITLTPGTERGGGSFSFVQPLGHTETSRTFLDIRAEYESDGDLTGSFGAASRWSFADDAVTLGGHVFLDLRETEAENSFKQVSAGLDLLGDMWELRGNYYAPIDREARVGPIYFGTPRLSGNFIVRDVLQDRDVALEGWDLQAGLRLPLSDSYDLRVVGGYYDLSEEGAPDLEGWRGRVEAWSGEDFAVGIEVRDDDWYGTQTFAVLRARLNFGEATRKKGSRLAAPIERRAGITVAEPGRSQPIFSGTQQYSFGLGGTQAGFMAAGTRILFVDDNATGGTGTFERPFTTVAQAAAASAVNDVIYLAEGSYTGNITLRAGQALIGAGTALMADSTVVLPAGTRPTLTATTGNVVTLNNNNLVSGLRITAPAGQGAANRDQFAAVYGNNVTGFTIVNNDFTGNTGTGGTSSVGVRLDNMGGVTGTRSQTRHFASNSSTLPFYGSYDPGVGGGNVEIFSFSNTGFGVVALGDAGAVDVVRFGTGDIAGLPIAVRRDNIAGGITASLGAAAAGNITTVSMDPNGQYYAVAVQHADGLRNGLVEFRNRATGAVLQRVTVGIGPDGTAISPDGRFLVVANEAERLDAPGSISIINLAGVMNGQATVTQVALTDQTGNFFDNSGALGTVIRTDIDNIANGPVAHTPNGLQPEYVAFSPDSRYAFITFQENNGAMVIDLGTGAPANIRYFNLGTVTQPADVRDTSPPVYDFTGQISGFNREPDGIAAFVRNGQLYFVTADEGDTRTNFSGSRLRGGRSVTVFNATTGQVVGTLTGLDQAVFAAGNAAMAANPTIYGVRNDGVNPHYYPEGRSDRGGVEPEVLTVFDQNNRTYALVGLERGASVALVDLSNPASPTVVSIGLLPRDLTAADGFDLAANSEGVVTQMREGIRFGYAGLEANGIMAIWRIVPPTTGN